MKFIKLATWSLGVLAAASIMPAAEAQQMIDQKARQKASWFNAPREIQIIDERPVVRDFREAPSGPQMMQLPPGPQGFGGAGGGGGAGAMGDGGGGSPVLPAGGMPIGDGGPGYRNAPQGMGGIPLDRAGFGNHTNIPARGMAPKGILPNGTTTGVHGSMMTPTARSAPRGQGAGGRGMAAAARPAAPVAASYGGPAYTSAPAYSGGGGSTSTNVRGVLLNRLNRK
jgi:hypothetical protein